MSLSKSIPAFLFVTIVQISLGQPPPPPPVAPPPPAFMTMKGYPLSCFDKPAFDEGNLEFFVCNGGAGLTGVRKKDDATHSIFVHDFEIALNLNMKAAKAACTGEKFSVRSGSGGNYEFRCGDKETSAAERFRIATRADWARYQSHMGGRN